MTVTTATPTIETYPWFERGTLVGQYLDEGACGPTQTGPSYSRQFQYNRPDGIFAIVNTTSYATTEYRERDGDGEETGRKSSVPSGLDNPLAYYGVTDVAEFIICTDEYDAGGTELWSMRTYDQPLYEDPTSHDDAVTKSKASAVAEDPAYYHHWNGEPTHG